LRPISREDLSECFQGDFHPCRALVPAAAAVLPEGRCRDVAAVLAVTVAPKDDDQPVFDDPGDNHVVNIDDAQIEISYLDAYIGAVHLAQETGDPVAVAATVAIGMFERLQVALGNLVQFDAADELPVGPNRGQVISPDVLED